jgi:amidase
LFPTALQLARQVRSGAVSAAEVVQQTLRRIDELQPRINAFTCVDHERALAEAAKIEAGDERPFAGVPVAIKDNRPVAGLPLTMGSDLWADIAPQHDAYVVRRLREAGFVIVGKTSLPEMGILPTTEPRRFGPTRNPWDLGRTPGGSSGGSAAAVASGMVPVAHGNDGGGSIRIPAACCGLVGLKPSRGRVSLGPDLGQAFLVSDGMLTRTVSETAELLDVLAGYEVGDATWAPAPERPYAELAGRDPGHLLIALALEPPLAETTLDPACEAAARDAALALESLGHEVQEITPPWSQPGLFDDFTNAFGPLISLTTWFGGHLSGREPTEAEVEPLTWEMWKRSTRENTLSVLTAQAKLEGFARAIVSFLHPYDLVLTPTLASPPVRIGEINGLGPDPWQSYERSAAFTPYTAIANVTGQPAISLPLYERDGLPIGVHLIGRPAREDTLLQAATQLEAVLPWADREPAL